MTSNFAILENGILRRARPLTAVLSIVLEQLRLILRDLAEAHVVQLNRYPRSKKLDSQLMQWMTAVAALLTEINSQITSQTEVENAKP